MSRGFSGGGGAVRAPMGAVRSGGFVNGGFNRGFVGNGLGRFGGFNNGFRGFGGSRFGFGYPYYGFGFGYGWPYWGGYYGGYYDPYYYNDGYYPDAYYGNSGGGYYPDSYYPDNYSSYGTQAPVVINQQYSPNPPSPSSASESYYRRPDYYLIAFNDQTIQAAVSFSVDGDQIRWTTREHVEKSAPLSTVDRRFSEQINRDRRVEFRLP